MDATSTLPSSVQGPSHRPLRFAARAGLLAWVGFWTWFAGSLAVTEFPAWQPMAAIAVLWALTAATWFAPRLGAVLLLAFAAWAGWLFAGSSALLLIVAPPCAIALASWFAARRPGA